MRCNLQHSWNLSKIVALALTVSICTSTCMKMRMEMFMKMCMDGCVFLGVPVYFWAYSWDASVCMHLNAYCCVHVFTCTNTDIHVHMCVRVMFLANFSQDVHVFFSLETFERRKSFWYFLVLLENNCNQLFTSIHTHEHLDMCTQKYTNTRLCMCVRTRVHTWKHIAKMIYTNTHTVWQVHTQTHAQATHVYLHV